MLAAGTDAFWELMYKVQNPAQIKKAPEVLHANALVIAKEGVWGVI